ncbi:hypothetical protein [Actinosynnema sp. NPDC023587]|uniref:hypothetical protein n=1 Tax=Actinosynnema sp. NPDC023587 TaxID=3154695 RepID=UPI0033F5217C
MALIPRTVPQVDDPQAAAVLAGRWSRVRRLLSIAALVVPGLLAVVCLVFFVLSGLRWWAAMSAVVAVGIAGALAWWLRRAVLEPPGWTGAVGLCVGCQLLLGCIPGYGAAANAASTLARASAGVLFAVCWVAAGVAVLVAHRAQRALMVPVVADLGATPFVVALSVRFAITTPDLVSARVTVGRDGVEWGARLHRGRGSGPRVAGGVPFGRLREVRPVVLSGHPELRPWMTMPDGTQLYAQPGPAVVLVADSGEWMIPVHDAALVAQLVHKRVTWASRHTQARR